MWYKQARQYTSWSAYGRWRRLIRRLERKINSGEDVPEKEMDKLLRVTQDAFGDTGNLQQQMDVAFELREKWKRMENIKRKEQILTDSEKLEENSVNLDNEDVSEDISMPNLKSGSTCMKINSNTVTFTKKSAEFNEIEDIIMKIAAVNGIKDVESVQIHIDSEKGTVGYKFSQNETDQPIKMKQEQPIHQQSAENTQTTVQTNTPEQQTNTPEQQSDNFQSDAFTQTREQTPPDLEKSPDMLDSDIKNIDKEDIDETDIMEGDELTPEQQKELEDSIKNQTVPGISQEELTNRYKQLAQEFDDKLSAIEQRNTQQQ